MYIIPYKGGTNISGCTTRLFVIYEIFTTVNFPTMLLHLKYMYVQEYMYFL